MTSFRVGVPEGWTLDRASSPESARVDYPSQDIVEMQVTFSFVPGQVDTSHALGAMTIAGERATLIADGPVLDMGQPAGYGRTAVLSHGQQTYELNCTAYAGTSTATMLAGCMAVADSVKFAGQ